MLGTEAGLKYFILGAISSALFLLGISLLYGQGISLLINEINWYQNESWLLKVSQSLILIPLLFKLTAAPFHVWIPDVYEGADLSIIVLVATIPKISVFVLILNLAFFSSIIIFSAIFSLILGTVASLNQSKTKRFLAYSAVTHIGFMLLGLNINNNFGLEAAYFYLIVYLIMSISILFIVSITPVRSTFIIDFIILLRKNKLLSITLSLLFLSVAGIPPLAGFISKWIILWINLNYQFFFISIVTIITSIVGAAYYLRVVKIIYFQPSATLLIWKQGLYALNPISTQISIWLGISIYFICFLIIHPQPWLLICHWSIIGLY